MRDVENFSSLATAYATPADFCRTFQQEMERLYLLSLLLTAEQHSAEQCFESSLGDCMDVRRVFKEWTPLWTRRIVLQNAIRMLRPAVNKAEEVSQSQPSSPASELDPALRAVLRLNTFERFVFVMSVLEGYSDHECSLLLGSSKRDVVAAKRKALEHLATTSKPTEFLQTPPQAEHQLEAIGNKQHTI